MDSPAALGPFLRAPYNYDVNEASDQAAFVSDEPSLTKQQFAEDADINTIVRRFRLTGQLPENVRMPTYGDFTEVSDFQTAMIAVAQARESFDAMPADIRARFHNDPGEFVDFCSDEKNRDEAIKLGLVPPPPPAASDAAVAALGAAGATPPAAPLPPPAPAAPAAPAAS